MKLEITFWDVGQGDCSMIRLPDGRMILIDVGPPDSPVIDWLAQRPHEQIYAVVLTHNDEDHAGCFDTLLQQFHSRIEHQFLLTDRSDREVALQRIVGAALRAQRNHGITLHRLEATPQAPQAIYGCCTPSPVALYAVHPDVATSLENQIARKPSPNRVSAILCLQVGGVVSVIWPGDSTVTAIAEACADMTPQMLVGPHHGAPVDRKEKSYQPAFDRLSAETVFISVGSRNRYDHPVPAYLEKHAKQKRRVCCTQLQHCDKGRLEARKSVLHNHLSLGVLPPRKSTAVTCRGPVVYAWDDHENRFVEDRFHVAHAVGVHALHKPLCVARA